MHKTRLILVKYPNDVIGPSKLRNYPAQAAGQLEFFAKSSVVGFLPY